MAKSLMGWQLSWKVLGGKLGAEWERDRRDTLFLMGSIALSGLTHIEHLPVWVSISFAVLFFWRLGLVLSGRWLPRQSIRLIAAFAAALAVFAEYKTLVGRDAGVSLLILFLGLKLMEMQAKRDLFVVIFLCMFLLLLSFLYSQSLFSAVLVGIALLTLITTLLSMQFGYHEAPMVKRFVLSGTLLLKSMPIALILFFLFPRIDQPLWKMPGESSGAKTGLSDSMAPSSISNLTESDEVAFRVQFEGGIPAQKDLYWRGPSFGNFDGKTWRAVKHELGVPPGPSVQFHPDDRAYRYTVTQEPTGTSQVFALEFPSTVPIIDERSSQVLPDFQLISASPIIEKTLYSTESRIGGKIGLNETPLTLQNWLTLPPGFNGKTLQLAIEWRNAEVDNRKLIARALQWFNKDQFFYTMNPPLYGKDGVDEFLFVGRKGFCEHYAQAFVVLMRALDIPARVVTGYQGGEPNPIDGVISVRQKDAHAWAEVWLEGDGWVRVDPTAAIAPNRILKPLPSRAVAPNAVGQIANQAAGLLDQFRFRLEAVSNGWNTWVLSYDRQKQRDLLKRFGLDLENWPQVVGLMAGLIALVLAIVALSTLHPREKKNPIDVIFNQACGEFEAIGIKRRKDETAKAFAARVQNESPENAEAFNAIAKLYNRLQYEQSKYDPQDIQKFRQLLKKIQA